MMGIPFMGISGAVLLLALAAGYLVCTVAKKEQGTSKTVGYIIGVAIIVVAGALILNGLVVHARIYHKMKCMGMMPEHGGMMKKDMPMPAPKK
jgi:hypothetical protein